MNFLNTDNTFLLRKVTKGRSCVGMNDQKKALVIINPRSGKMKSQAPAEEISALFEQNGYEPTVYSTTARGDATQYAKLLAKNFDVVVCRGGDGTLNEVVNGLTQASIEVPIGYIPAGTSNDFASTMGIPLDAKKAVKIITAGSPVTQDIGFFTDDRYFIYTASFGVFTRASYATPQKRKNRFGYYAYLAEGAKDLLDLQQVPMRVTCDDRVYEGNYVFGAITNSLIVGGIIHYDREIVDFSDGKFEVILVKKPDSPKAWADVVSGILRHKFDERYITFDQCSEIKIECDEVLPWTIDGEYGGKQTNLAIKNIPNAIKIYR